MAPSIGKCGEPRVDQISCAVQHEDHQSVPLSLKANAPFQLAMLAQIMCLHHHLYHVIFFLMGTGEVPMSSPLGPLIYSRVSSAPPLPHNVSLKIPNAMSQSQLTVTRPAPLAGLSLPLFGVMSLPLFLSLARSS